MRLLLVAAATGDVTEAKGYGGTYYSASYGRTYYSGYTCVSPSQAGLLFVFPQAAAHGGRTDGIARCAARVTAAGLAPALQVPLLLRWRAPAPPRRA